MIRHLSPVRIGIVTCRPSFFSQGIIICFTSLHHTFYLPMGWFRFRVVFFFFFFALTSCCFQSFRFCTLSCVSTAAFKYPIICAFSVSEISSYSFVIHPTSPIAFSSWTLILLFFLLLLLPSFEAPQWGTADAEIKVSSDENTELKDSPSKAWSRSVYCHSCYAYCRRFLPC